MLTLSAPDLLEREDSNESKDAVLLREALRDWRQPKLRFVQFRKVALQSFLKKHPNTSSAEEFAMVRRILDV